MRGAIVGSVLWIASCGARPAPEPAAPVTTDEVTAPDADAPACGPLGAPIVAEPEVAYREARALSDAGRFVEAADLHAAIVRASPQHELAPMAAELSLDALHRVGGDAGGACAARIASLADEYRSLFGCAEREEERCVRLAEVRCAALRVEAESIAEADPASASRAFERVAHSHCPRADEALYNAAVLARRAGDATRAESLSLELRTSYPESPVLRAPPP